MSTILKKSKKIPKKFQGKYLFLTLPHFEVSQDVIATLKIQIFHEIMAHQKDIIEHVGVVRQHHHDSSFHIHIYLQYIKRRKLSPKHFDYLPKHPNVQVVRGLKEVLSYLVKEDTKPLFSKNFNPRYEIDKRRIEKEPFALLYEAMSENPQNFNPWVWIAANNLDVAASKGNWPKAISQLKHRQQIEANKVLRSKIGIQYISRQLIESILLPHELKHYDSWSGYQNIIDHLNHVSVYNYARPHKSKNLLVVGRPNIGKTALAHKIRKYVAVYSFGVDNWFPRYENQVYPMILWNQFYLRAMPYGQLLNILEGEYTDLPFKGGSVLKQDNQLIYITSNMTLQQHICSRFKDSVARDLSRANLGARITQVIIPDDKDLFLLLKLIIPCT